MNNRIAPRKPFQTRVVFEDEFNEEFLYFVSTNISTSGIFIQTALPFKPGTRVLLKFSLYEGEAPIETAAEIMRFHDKKRGPGRKRPVTTGVGLKFLGLSREDLKRIENFIHG
jgi:uncharacterized protein (TIGR02266 family)